MISLIGRMLTGIFLATMAALLTGCQTSATVETKPEDHAVLACYAFEPIHWSSKDTPVTVKQISQHNAVWDAMCSPIFN